MKMPIEPEEGLAVTKVNHVIYASTETCRISVHTHIHTSSLGTTQRLSKKPLAVHGNISVPKVYCIDTVY